jgi:hypothetical protein
MHLWTKKVLAWSKLQQTKRAGLEYQLLAKAIELEQP